MIMDGQKTFGETVAEARTMLGMSITGAAGKLEMTEALLTDIEDGLVEMNPALQETFERAYTIDLSGALQGRRLPVARRPLTYDAERGVLQIDNFGVRFRVGVDSNDVLLRGFSSALRRLRRLAPNVPILSLIHI